MHFYKGHCVLQCNKKKKKEEKENKSHFYYTLNKNRQFEMHCKQDYSNSACHKIETAFKQAVT